MPAHGRDEKSGLGRSLLQAANTYSVTSSLGWMSKRQSIKSRCLYRIRKNRDTLAGARIQSVDEFMAELRNAVRAEDKVSKRAIPEQYPRLRILQLALNEYYHLQTTDGDQLRYHDARDFQSERI